MPSPAITCFGILGTGTLGWRIGLQAALSGYQVLMYDISEGQIQAAIGFQEQFSKRLVKRKRYTAAEAEAAVSRIDFTTSADSFASRVDFVSESVTEDLALKKKVWSGFAGRWQNGTRLTTNTSYLLPSQLVDAVGESANFCAFHFHDVFDARVVDVMPHPGTDPEFVDFLLELGRTLDQIPVHVKQETSGYLFNHMLLASLGAAGHLLAQGRATVADIDRSWMGNFGTPIGPFGTMDQVGLDTVLHILNRFSDSRSVAFRSIIQPLVAAGKLGVKTGSGFYDYPRPAYAAPDFLC